METIYTDAPPEIEEALEHAIIIEDFLPSSEFLIMRKNDKQAVSSQTTFVRKQKHRELAFA